MSSGTMAEPGSMPGPLLAPSVALSRGFEFLAQGPEPATAPRAATAASDRSGPVLLREGFRMGELRLMIHYEDGNELTDLPPVYRLPRAPGWFLGMANLHGTLVPVFDPAALFGVAHASEAKPMLLVLGHGDEKAGVVIDGLPQRLRFTAADRIENAAVPEALANCVAEAYWYEGLDWLDLQVDALLRTLGEQLAGNAP
ncbi:MAG TPA: chemotaxis protein CheW [Ramlibacter sp.]|nr:chemotaxis protein CheW [Ramlibacter sp.]